VLLAALTEGAATTGERLTSLGEHELLVFWVQLFVLVSLARTFGFGFRKLGLPSVIGELMAGLVLGPSVFGQVWPSGFDWFLPESVTQSAALLAVSWIGILLLLVVTGFETDLSLIAKLGKPVAWVSAGSLIVPFVAGLVLAYQLPESIFVGDDTTKLAFALFIATALSVSALAVVAKILSEMGLMRRDFGQITVAVGMANDLIGWIMLGIFTGIATSGQVSVSGIAATVGGLALFIGLALTVGQRGVDWALKRVRRDGHNISGALSVCMIVVLGFGVVTQYLGIEAVLGAFIAGVVLVRSRFQQDEVIHHIESLTAALFAPLFFATAGLRLDLRTLNDSEALAWTAGIIGVAIGAKFVGAYGGARLAGRDHRAGLALGAGLNARGALEVVIGTVGLSLGVFSKTAFTVIVLVPVVTSIFASLSLRVIVRGFHGSPEELKRLGREEALSRNLVVKNTRLLIPSRGHPASIAAAQLLHFAWPAEAGATILTVSEDGVDLDVDVGPLRNVLHGRDVEHRQVKNSDPVSVIVAESHLGFGVIGIGASDVADGQIISSFVDEVLSEAPIPVVVVRRGRNLERPLPGAFTRALVPVAGTPGSRAAQEVAFNLGAGLGTEIVVAHVETRSHDGVHMPRLFHRRSGSDSHVSVGEQLLTQSAELAAELGVEPQQVVRQHRSPAEEIVRMAVEIDADLVVMGANLRKLDGRPFLGHNVEHVLAKCDATVAVVLVPFDL
jgi:Kef-type K+ transport system membrane component KefB/nucleotide-binding universal stress UspA family protein